MDLLVAESVSCLRSPVPVRGEAVTVLAALLHVLTDLSGSIAARASGLVVTLTGRMRDHPASTLLIAA